MINLYAQNNSQTLYTELEKKGLQPLAIQSDFSFNIYLSFFDNSHTYENTQELIFLLSQNDIFHDNAPYDALLDYALFLSKEPPPYPIKIILMAGNHSLLPSEYRIKQNTALEAVIENSSTFDTSAVFVLSSQKPADTYKNTIRILCGSSQKTAPLWQVQSLISASRSISYSFSIIGTFLSLYRLGWIENNPIVQELISNDIPALELMLPQHMNKEDSRSFFIALQNFFTENPMTQQWDTHYTVWSIFGKPFFITETLLVYIMLIAAGVSLFLVIGLSFIFGTKQLNRRKDFLYTWWLIPVLFALIWLSLLVGQSITQWLYQLLYGSATGWLFKPYTALLAKTLFALTIILIIVLPQRLFHFPQDEYIYGYFAYIVSIFNMFFFTGSDFSLLLLFVCEYILAFIFSRTKRTIPMLITAFIMVLPFIIYIRPILGSAMRIGVETMFSGNSFWNLRLTLLLLPFAFVCIKILIKLKLFGAYALNDKKTLVRRVPYTVLLFLSASIIFGIIILQSKPFSPTTPFRISVIERVVDSVVTDLTIQNNAPLFDPDIKSDIEVHSKTLSRIHITTQKNSFLDRTSVLLSVRTDTLMQQLEISVSTKSGFAVYDADYPFETFNNGSRCVFYFDEPPPNPLKIQFTTARNAELEIAVTGFSIDNPDKIISEKPFVLLDTVYIETKTVNP